MATSSSVRTIWSSKSSLWSPRIYHQHRGCVQLHAWINSWGNSHTFQLFDLYGKSPWSIQNRFIILTWLGVNSRAAFWFTAATHKPRVHVHVTSHPDPRGAVHDVQFFESTPPDLAIHECIHRSICVCNRTHPVTQAIVDDISLAASFVSACLSWLLYLILSRLHSVGCCIWYLVDCTQLASVFDT